MSLLGLIVLAIVFGQQGGAQSKPIPRLLIDTQSDPQTTGYPNSRKLVRDSQGNLYVAYRKKEGDDAFHIFVARLPQGKNRWEKPVQVDDLTGFDQRVPSLTIDAQDRLHIVWYGRNASDRGKNERQIFYAQAQAADSLTWTQPSLLADVPGYGLIKPEPKLWQEHPVIHSTTPGHLYVAWEGRDETHQVKAQIKVMGSVDGGVTWSQWRNLPGEPNSYYSRPTLVSSSDGAILYLLAYATRRDQEVTHLVWTRSDAATGPLGEQWEPWAYVTDPANGDECSSQQDQRQVSLVIDPADQLHIVWQQRGKGKGQKTQICYARFRQGAWEAPEWLASKPDRFQAFPHITVDKDSRLWAVWNEFTQEPDFQGKETPGGTLRAAKRRLGDLWTPLDLTGLTTSSTVLYPSLRWHRSTYRFGVDLIWLERDVNNAAAEVGCFERSDQEQKQPRCVIYYANLAGL